jgi:tyrosinase
MQTVRHLLGVIMWALVALAQSYDFGVDMEPLTRRQQSHIIVGRLPLASNGSIPHRLEIRQMRANQYQWDLFVLALSMFQSVSQSDPLSWYQVAGTCAIP